jgi:hypothetical protein
MGLTYHYKFTAPASVSAKELESFLKKAEKEAVTLRFKPTTVLNVCFDTPERREFSRRLGPGFSVQDERLKGVALPLKAHLREHDQNNGEGLLVPEKGVVLVVTDEQGREICFGFMRYPRQVKDINGQVLAETGFGDRWAFQEFVKTPDQRFRRIVKLFTEAGYLESERDDYAAK